MGLLPDPNEVLENTDPKDFDDALLVSPPVEKGPVVVCKTIKHRTPSELIELTTTLFLKHHPSHPDYRTISLQHSPLPETDRDYYDDKLTEILPNRPNHVLAESMRSSKIINIPFDQVSLRIH